MYSVDVYNRVRRACLKDGMSAREVARVFGKDRKTIAKMLRHELPPGYRRSSAPRRPTLDGFIGVIDETLRTDKTLIKKQRNKEVFVPLAHRPGHAQVDFGETLGVIGGLECKVHFFAMSLPHSDAVFVKGYPAETTEAFSVSPISSLRSCAI